MLLITRVHAVGLLSNTAWHSIKVGIKIMISFINTRFIQLLRRKITYILQLLIIFNRDFNPKLKQQAYIQNWHCEEKQEKKRKFCTALNIPMLLYVERME